MPIGNIDVFIRLVNSRRFMSQLTASATEVRAFAAEMEAAGAATGNLNTATHVASGLMYGLGAAVDTSSFALVGLATAFVGFGTEFNATMEGNYLAFDHFAGGVQHSKKLVHDLFVIARDTPFSFTDITTAARQFLSFGFSVRDTTGYLKTLGDVLSYTGGGSLQVTRLTKAMGDIQSKGRLMQQELNQLTNVGINWRKALDLGGLHLTQKQLLNVGKAGIPASKALPALKKGLDAIYGGGSRKYLQTFNGQLQRFTDNIRQMMGQTTQKAGIFGAFKSGLQWLNDKGVPAMSKFFNGKGFKNGLSNVFHGIGTGVKIAVGAIKVLLDALAPAAPMWTNVLWPLIKGIAVGLVGAIISAVPVLKMLAGVIGFVGKILSPFKGLIKFIGEVIAFVFGGEILRVIGLIGKFGRVFRILAIPIKIVSGLFGIVERFIGFLFKGFGGAIRFVASLRNGFSTAMHGIILAIGHAWDGFGTWLWSKTGAVIQNIANRIGALGPSFVALATKIKNAFVSGLKGFGKAVLHAMFHGVAFVASIGSDLKKWINDHTIFGDDIHIGPIKTHIPALATGGHIMGGGYALVGESGPEVVRLPAGASVAPNRPARARVNPGGSSLPGVSPSGGFHVAVEAPIYLERRQIGRAMGEYVAERNARK